jgi:hypothetical protein
MLVVGTKVPSDSTATRHVHGYGGIVPIPPAAEGAVSSDLQQALEMLGQRRITVRNEKSGRILYANERVTLPASADEARNVSPSTRAKHPCTQLVQRTTVGSPNS